MRSRKNNQPVFWVLIGVLITLAFYQTPAAAQPIPLATNQSAVGREVPSKGIQRRQRGQQRHKMTRELGLTQEQVNKIREIRENQREEIRSIQSEISEKMKQFQTMFAGDATETTVRSLFAEISTLKQKLAQIHLDGLIASRKILKPEQRNVFTTMMPGFAADGPHDGGMIPRGPHRRGTPPSPPLDDTGVPPPPSSERE